MPPRLKIFQFTPLREGRRQHPPSCPTRTYFNSRPSARGDASAPEGVFVRINFNSRPSARGDNARIPAPVRQPISIHAPPRGATNVVGDKLLHICYFNSRPSARGDGADEYCALTSQHFNSRPSARGDYRSAHLPSSGSISIHAPPRGATSWEFCKHIAKIFQFTPLREGRRSSLHSRIYEW